MGVQHGVRRTLIALAGGAVAQRLCQLAAFVLIGRALGVGGLGVYAQGMALGAALAALAAAGLGQATARAVAARPAAAGAIVRTAVRRRLVVGIALATGCGLIASATASEPWFWWLCALQTLPSAWDQKLALDASGRTRVDARVEAAAALLQLGATAALVLADHAAPVAFAAAALAARCLHAAGAAHCRASAPMASPASAATAHWRAARSPTKCSRSVTCGSWHWRSATPPPASTGSPAASRSRP
jgi:O-antigen/teichoic acid export membrane protein